MSDRDAIFARIRAALAPLPERAPLPQFADSELWPSWLGRGQTPLEVFRERLARVSGRCFSEPAALVEFLQEQHALTGYVDPLLHERLAPTFPPGFRLHDEFRRGQVDDYAFAVTRARGAIAETGSIILSDALSPHRLAAVAPWIHVAVLRTSEIVETLGQALAALGADPNLIFCTGPSKTADVEGILIEGVHGPGQQIALILEDL
jgi:L-lactate dehydrogenase complex protein LldG